jgi:hypothetical protein
VLEVTALELRVLLEQRLAELDVRELDAAAAPRADDEEGEDDDA